MTSQHPVPARKPRILSLLALISLAGAGCGDDTATAPEAVQASVTAGTSAKAPRTPYISDLKLHFPVVDMGPDGTYDNGYDIAVMNPGQKTDGVYYQVELQQNQYTSFGGGTAVFCPTLNGVLPHGTCLMTFYITPPASPFVTGPARLTIRLLQNRLDRGVTLLDSRTVDVEIVHS